MPRPSTESTAVADLATSSALATRNGPAVLVAPIVARLTWPFDRLSTADGHHLRASFSASVRAIDNAAERAALAEVLLADRGELLPDTVATHFQPALDRAARDLTPTQPATHWLGEPGSAELRNVLRRAAETVAFSCGLEILSPIDLQTSSPSLEAAAEQDRLRTAADRATADRFDQLESAVRRLREIESASDGDASRVTLAIGLLDADDRRAVERVRRADAAKQITSAALLAVAGTSLLRFDATGVTAASRIDLPDTLGPFRSIAAATIAGEPGWLIGARSGVLVLDSALRVKLQLADESIQSARGFSAAIAQPDRIVAAHGDAGLIAWTLSDSKPFRLGSFNRADDLNKHATSTHTADTAPGPRHLLDAGDHNLLFAVGGQLMRLGREDRATPIGSNSGMIVSLLPTADGWLIVRDTGEIERLARGSDRLEPFLRHARRIAVAASVGQDADACLLLAGDDGVIDRLDPRGDPLTGLITHHAAVRRLVAGRATVGAIVDDRTRLLAWPLAESAAPGLVAAVAPLTSHRVADVAIAEG